VSGRLIILLLTPTFYQKELIKIIGYPEINEQNRPFKSKSHFTIENINTNS